LWMRWRKAKRMAKLYGILAVIGWIWFLVVIVFLIVRVRRAKGSERRGFEVVERHDDSVNANKQQH
jgi:hypothetical protein